MRHSRDMKTLVYNIGELATYNPERAQVQKVENAALEIDGRIVSAILSGEDTPDSRNYDVTIDAAGKLVTPGFVDPHTHSVYAQSRETEFEMRIEGASYQEIAAKGGGIRNSVRQLRQLTQDDLKARVKYRLGRLLSYGTTTVEAKSGYGLNTEYEMISLKVLEMLRQELPMEIISTFLGAHEIPDEYQDNRDGYIQLIVEEMLPKIAKENLAEFCDVFCETGVFSIDETRTILEAARKHGFKLTVHSDEFDAIGGTELAAELGAQSANHLMAVTAEGISAMKENGVVPVVLPGTSFFLGGKKYAPARKMWDAGLPVALATDFNPGSSMTPSMQMVVNLGCIALNLTPDEVLQASTYHSALALDRAARKGALYPGFDADFLLWDVQHWNQVPYEFGTNKVAQVFIGGVLVHQNLGESFFSSYRDRN